MFTHPTISHGKIIFYNISSFVDVFDFSIERKKDLMRGIPLQFQKSIHFKVNKYRGRIRLETLPCFKVSIPKG